MKKEVVRADGVYVYPGISPAVKIDNMVYTSGQVPFDEKGNLVGIGDVKTQTRQSLENLRRVVEAGGGSVASIVKVNYYVVDYRLMSDVSEVVAEFFSEPFPAALGVEVAKLGHPDLLIEIDAIAATDA